MSYWLNFDKQEKGYERISVSKDKLKSLMGKRIVYITSRDVDSLRGYCFPRFGVVSGFYRNRVLLNDSDKDVDIKSIIEAGVKIEL